MIETFYGTDQLVLQAGPRTFFVALLIGLAFGFALSAPASAAHGNSWVFSTCAT